MQHFKITTLGSGTFFVDKNVSASAFLVEVDSKKILIDCGPGTLIKLSEAGYEPSDIDYVFITHLHPDHVSDLFPLFMNYMLDDAFGDEPIDKYPVFYGPDILEKYMRDYSHLTQLHAYDHSEKLEIRKYDLEFELGDLKVKTYDVVHKPFGVDTEGYALRFEYGDKVLAFSGDSADCPGVRDVCKDADLFICDCSFPKSRERDDIHMNTAEIGEISEAGGVKEVMLDHFYPHFSDTDLVGEVKEVYKGKVSRAEDLEVTNIV
jgi:ribonuclease BN (tRNA processing enzyme)